MKIFAEFSPKIMPVEMNFSWGKDHCYNCGVGLYTSNDCVFVILSSFYGSVNG